jgi:hypothetical protein
VREVRQNIFQLSKTRNICTTRREHAVGIVTSALFIDRILAYTCIVLSLLNQLLTNRVNFKWGNTKINQPSISSTSTTSMKKIYRTSISPQPKALDIEKPTSKLQFEERYQQLYLIPSTILMTIRQAKK